MSEHRLRSASGEDVRQEMNGGAGVGVVGDEEDLAEEPSGACYERAVQHFCQTTSEAGMTGACDRAFRAWVGFSAHYAEAWRRSHAPEALVGTADGQLGLLRRGGALTLMRTSSTIEAMDTIGGMRSGSTAGLFRIFTEALGAPATWVLNELAFRGAATQPAAVALAVNYLREGDPPHGFRGADLRSDDEREQLAAWRRRARVFSLQIGERLRPPAADGSAPTMLSADVFRAALTVLETPAPVPGTATWDATTAPAAQQRLLTPLESASYAGARQVSLFRLHEAQGMVLFAAYVGESGVWCGLTSEEAYFVQLAQTMKELQPRAFERVREAQLAAALTTRQLCARTLPLPPHGPPPLHALTSTPPSSERPSNSSAQDHILYLAEGLLSNIRWGDVSGAGLAASAPMLAARVAEMGHTLHSCGQIGPLEEVLTLVGDGEETFSGDEDTMGTQAALLFLRALCACTYLQSGALGGDELQNAISLFLRAAHGVESEHVLLLRPLRQFRVTMGVSESEAITKLVYLETVMLWFERLDCPAGAAALAYAALRQADLLVSTSDDNMAVGSAAGGGSSSSAEVAREVAEGQRARLWANLFKYTVRLDRFEEAHAVLLAVPDPVRRVECLRLLIAALLERGAAQTLVELPYCDAGPSGDEGLVAEVARVLEQSGAHADPSANAHPLKILFSFHIRRSAYKAAAIAMLKRGRQLQSAAEATLHRLKSAGRRAGVQQMPGGASTDGTASELKRLLGLQAESMAASLHALRLADGRNRWIVENHKFWRGELEKMLESVAPQAKRARYNDRISSSYVDGGMSGGDAAAAEPVSRHPVTSAEDLARETALAEARVELLAAGDAEVIDLQDLVVSPLAATATARALAIRSRFSSAEHLLRKWLSGAGLQHELCALADSLARQCVILQVGQAPSQEETMGEEIMMMTEFGDGAGGGGGAATVASTVGSSWEELRGFLERSREDSQALALAAAAGVLASEPRTALPPWLTALLGGNMRLARAVAQAAKLGRAAAANGEADWHELKKLLDRPALEPVRSQLARAARDEANLADKSVATPAWLVDYASGRGSGSGDVAVAPVANLGSFAAGFAKRGGADLAAFLRLLLSYDQVEEAARLVIRQLHGFETDSSATDRLEGKRHGKSWFPYPLLAAVSERLAAAAAADAALAPLRDELTRHFAKHEQLLLNPEAMTS